MVRTVTFSILHTHDGGIFLYQTSITTAASVTMLQTLLRGSFLEA